MLDLRIFNTASSVLIHPNTNDSFKDHTELATWMGKPWPLYTDMLKPEGRFDRLAAVAPAPSQAATST